MSMIDVSLKMEEIICLEQVVISTTPGHKLSKLKSVMHKHAALNAKCTCVCTCTHLTQLHVTGPTSLTPSVISDVNHVKIQFHKISVQTNTDTS